MCVFGTRPEVVKLAPVVKALKKSSHLEPIIVLTTQHRDMLDQMLSWFEIEAHHDLDLMRHGQTLAQLTSRVVLGIDKVLQEIQPDIMLVQGDTITVMAAALAAFYHKIPVGHVEAGLRTKNKYNPFPEEMARRLTAPLSTIHFAPTKQAVENLRSEGMVENVYLTGNTVIDALLETVSKLKHMPINQKLFSKVDFEHHRVLLVTAHRRENWGQSMSEIALALRQIADEFPDVQILYPIHKNPVVRESIEPVFKGHPRLLLIEPLDYVPFVYAMQRSFFILTDSGGIQEEAPSLGKPVLVMRTTTERPEAVEAGAARLVGIKKEGIVEAARVLLNNPDEYSKMSHVSNPFGDGQSAQRIVSALEDMLM